MKRLKPEERKHILQKLIDQLYREFYDWLCRYGSWNRDKLVEELKRKLRNNNGK